MRYEVTQPNPEQLQIREQGPILASHELNDGRKLHLVGCAGKGEINGWFTTNAEQSTLLISDIKPEILDWLQFRAQIPTALEYAGGQYAIVLADEILQSRAVNLEAQPLQIDPGTFETIEGKTESTTDTAGNTTHADTAVILNQKAAAREAIVPMVADVIARGKAVTLGSNDNGTYYFLNATTDMEAASAIAGDPASPNKSMQKGRQLFKAGRDLIVQVDTTGSIRFVEPTYGKLPQTPNLSEWAFVRDTETQQPMTFGAYGNAINEKDRQSVRRFFIHKLENGHAAPLPPEEDRLALGLADYPDSVKSFITETFLPHNVAKLKGILQAKIAEEPQSYRMLADVAKAASISCPESMNEELRYASIDEMIDVIAYRQAVLSGGWKEAAKNIAINTAYEQYQGEVGQAFYQYYLANRSDYSALSPADLKERLIQMTANNLIDEAASMGLQRGIDRLKPGQKKELGFIVVQVLQNQFERAHVQQGIEILQQIPPSADVCDARKEPTNVDYQQAVELQPILLRLQAELIGPQHMAVTELRRTNENQSDVVESRIADVFPIHQTEQGTITTEEVSTGTAEQVALNALLKITQLQDEGILSPGIVFSGNYLVRTEAANDAQSQNKTVYSQVIFPNSLTQYIRFAGGVETSIEKKTVLDGPCLFDANSAQIQMQNGEWYALTNPHQQLEQPVIPGTLRINPNFTPYEMDALMRNTQTIIALAQSDASIDRFRVNVPDVEYYHYMIDAYESGYVTAETVMEWMDAVDTRAGRIIQETTARIQANAPWLEIVDTAPIIVLRDYLRTKISQGERPSVEEELKILCDQPVFGEVFRKLIAVSKPKTFRQINYLSYVVAELTDSMAAGRMTIAVEDPAEEKILAQASGMFGKKLRKDGIPINLVGVYPHERTIPTGQERAIYFVAPVPEEQYGQLVTSIANNYQ